MNLLKLKSALLFTACALCLQSQAQNMTSTLVGSQGSGYDGDGGPASLAKLDKPSDICMDSDYNIYIADMGNHVVRKIDAQTGIITTIAGDGTSGNSGDNGPAINAQLSVPAYICLDNNNNLYISDGATYIYQGGNHNIRKVSLTTGIITTVAGTGSGGFSGDGGPATSAQLSNPAEIVCDAMNNIYFVDNDNHRVRKINSQTGIISTIAGGGSDVCTNGAIATDVALNKPFSIAINKSGKLYFSDEWGSRIRQVNLQTGTISTIMGEGYYFMEAYPAVNAKAGNVYGMYCDGHGDLYVDDESCSCRRIDSLDGNVYRVAGDTLMEGYNGDSGPSLTTWFNRPIGLTVHPITGEAIVADMFNNRVRMVTQPGYVSTIPEEPQLIEIVNGPELNVYPNPSSGRFAVQNTGVVNDTKLEVYNSIGAMVYSGMLKDRQQIIDITEQPSGIYHIVMTAEGKKQVQKMIISK